MDVEVAVGNGSLGSSKLIGYAHRMFEATDKLIADFSFEHLQETRQSILPQIQKSPEGKPLIIGERQATVFDDLLFHATHAGRHLGMIEALRGTLFSIPGTASV